MASAMMTKRATMVFQRRNNHGLRGGTCSNWSGP
jgi:hypothetical protein